MEKPFTTTLNKLSGSLVEIEGEITLEELQKHKAKALKKLSENLSLPGFRKGHIPDSVVIKNVSEMGLLQEMAEMALSLNYPKMVMEHDINAISQPQVSITKLAPENPLGFKITIPIMPEITLSDYKEIAKKHNSKETEKIEVKDEEVDALIEELSKQAKKTNNKIDDEFAQSLGQFKNLADLKEKAKEGITKEKEIRAKDKKRLEMMEEIIKTSKIDLPEIIIESELGKMLNQFRGNIEASGLNFKEYLEKANKKEDDLRREWREDAKKRSSFQLILNKIALEEKIIADKELLEKETKHIMEHNKEAKEENIRAYTEMILTNEKVFEFLEKV